MVLVFEGTPDQYSIDNYIKSNLDYAKERVAKKFDWIATTDGDEGAGKSVFSMQMLKYLDPTFCIERVVFTPYDFQKAILVAKPFQAILYDEGYGGLGSRATMSMINRMLVKMFTEIRYRQLFVIVVLPSFFDLDKYMAIHRTRVLFHVYCDHQGNRGHVASYNKEDKKMLYILGKKFYSYASPQPTIPPGTFSAHYAIPQDLYDAKKRQNTLDQERKAEEKRLQQQIEDLMLERVMNLDESISHTIKMKILDMPSSTYFRKLQKFQEQE